MPNTNPISRLLADRFNLDPKSQDPSALTKTHMGMAARGSCRDFTDQPVDWDLIQTLCALALASPTKSDLQQRDIILIMDPQIKAELSRLVSGQTWVAKAPMLAVFCANNRRQRMLHDWRGLPFANDHLDAFFNASVDAGIALSAFVIAAEAAGLGCCPISAMRNEAQAVSDLLHLPDHVFPVAGLAFGHPENPPKISKRLPLKTTLHTDRYTEQGLKSDIQTYDTWRAQTQPYTSQRNADQYAPTPHYSWIEDKTRQYTLPERADFGAFIRKKGFKLG